MKKNNLIRFGLMLVILLQLIFFTNAPLQVVQADSIPADALTNPQEIPFVQSEEFPIQQEWYSVGYGYYFGSRGVIVTDLDNDGCQEILSADAYFANSRWLVLQSSGPDQYQPKHIHERYTDRSLYALDVADFNGDGVQEIIATTHDNWGKDLVIIYSGSDYSQLGSFRPKIRGYNIEAADANGDGSPELIISDEVGLVAYSLGDFSSPQLLWETAGYGGLDLEVANVDADPALEIISSSGYVLNGVTRAVEWDYSANGFGRKLKVGDTDGDGQPEIIASRVVDTVGVFNAINHTLEWEIMNRDVITALTVEDTNGDGRPEILFGGEWRRLFAYDGKTRQELWRIDNNNSKEIIGIGVGDLDADGEIEMIWNREGTADLTVTNLADRSIEWQPVSFAGYYPATAVGDLDGDGRKEIVRTTDVDVLWNDYRLSVFDADTHAVVAQTAVDMAIKSIRLGDVDQDGQVEIVLAGKKDYSGYIQIHDGTTLAMEKKTYTYNGAFTALELGDVDSDGQMEIVGGVGTGSGLIIVVFDGVSAHVEWQSYGLSANSNVFSDLHLADADGNGRVEIFASIYGGDTFVFDGSDHTLRAQIPNAGYALTTADLDGDGKPSLLISKATGVYESYNASSFVRESTYLHDNVIGANALQVMDFDEDGSLEWLVAENGYLRIYSNDTGMLLWQSKALDLRYPDDLGIYGQMFVGQMDADARPEILIGSEEGLFQFEGPDLNPLRDSRMEVSQTIAQPGNQLVYTIELKNRGGATYTDARIENPLPVEIDYVPDSLWVSTGNALFENNVVRWDGTLDGFQTVTLTYAALIKPALARSGQIINSAQLFSGAAAQAVSVATALGDQISFLPAIQKGITVNHCIDYIDDFSDPTSGWPSWNDGVVEIGYSNGNYIIDGSNFGNLYMVKAPTCTRLNYSVAVDAALGTDHEGFLGLLFGLADDFSRFYMFVINPTSYEYALYYVNGNVLDKIAGWNDFVGYGGNPVTLKATRDGSRIVLQINDKVLGEWFDDRISGLTNFGLVNFPYTSIIDGSTRATFDNYKIRSIRNSTMQSQYQDIFGDSRIYTVSQNWTKREFNGLPMR